jgi:hypothetical protein
MFSTCCCFVYFLSQQYIRNLSNIPHAFFYNVFYAVYIKGGLNCHKLSSLYIENDNDRLNNVIFWGFIFERNAEWKDTCWWGKYLSMKRIWYIPGTLFLYFAVFAIPNRKKTISYHKKKTETQQVCITFFALYSFTLALFTRNLPQSFHCRLRWASRVDSADSNTKIRQLNTKYCTNMCVYFRNEFSVTFYRMLLFIMCISMP